MDTDAAFLRSIEADLADPAPILIYADWLEEQGKDQLAHAWRWMGRRGYRPHRRPEPGGVRWVWWYDSELWMLLPPEDQPSRLDQPEGRLHGSLFYAMGGTGDQLLYHSLAEAVERLAVGLQVLREQAGLQRQAGDP